MDYRAQWKSVEKMFLSYLLSDKKYIALSLGKVKKEYLPNTAEIYDMIVSYYNKFKDVITDEMAEKMWRKKNYSDDIIVNYQIITADARTLKVTNDAEFEAIIEELKDWKNRQDLLKMADQIQRFNPIHCDIDKLEELKDNIKKQVTEITSEQTQTRNEGTIKDSVKDRLEKYKQIKNNPELVKCIKTGFKKIDNAEGGFRPGELIYVIGRKGDGKSVLLLNLAHNAWEQGENIILFSLEISKEDYERRFDARAAQVSSNGLKRGTLTDTEEELYEKYLVNIEQGLTVGGKKAGTIYIVDCPAGCTPAYIDSKVDIIEQQYNIKFGVIITDYSGIMMPNIPVEAKRHEQGQIALDLKRIARTRECVVVSAAQMSRKGREETKSNGAADTAHIAESDQIADHIDWGISITSTSDMCGKIESFKTRDAAPFQFQFNKRYSCMTIQELDDDWADVGGPL